MSYKTKLISMVSDAKENTHIKWVHNHLHYHKHKYLFWAALATTVKLVWIKSIIAITWLATLFSSFWLISADDVDTLLFEDAEYIVQNSDINNLESSDLVFFDLLSQLDKLFFDNETNEIIISQSDDNIVVNQTDSDIEVTLPRDISVIIDSTWLPYEESLVLESIGLSELPEDIVSENILTAIEFGSKQQWLLFSKPIQLSIPTNQTENSFVSVVVYHNGTIKTWTLSNDLWSSCIDGISSSPSSLFRVINGKITFTTCSASTFIVNNPDAFITTWKTNNAWVTNNTTIRIPGTWAWYDYDIKRQEVGNPSNSGMVL